MGLNGWFVQYDLTIFLRAGDAVLDGVSPYPAVSELVDDTSYVYPPLLALLMAPLALLPSGLAASIFTFGGILALVGALLLLGVRDPRCHVVAILSPLTHEALRWGRSAPTSCCSSRSSGASATGRALPACPRRSRPC